MSAPLPTSFSSAERRLSCFRLSRLHYNIYYVLHLMENGPFPVSSGQSGWGQKWLCFFQLPSFCHHCVCVCVFLLGAHSFISQVNSSRSSATTSGQTMWSRSWLLQVSVAAISAHIKSSELHQNKINNSVFLRSTFKVLTFLHMQ